MYFRDLLELEAQMHGHAAAFLQLNEIADRSEAFNTAFGKWLSEQHGLSSAAGWAHALQQDAEAKRTAPLFLLTERLNEFWKDW